MLYTPLACHSLSQLPDGGVVALVAEAVTTAWYAVLVLSMPKAKATTVKFITFIHGKYESLTYRHNDVLINDWITTFLTNEYDAQNLGFHREKSLSG